MKAPEPVRLALFLASLFEARRIDYVFVGSLASSVHGEPRTSRDIDCVVALDAERVEAFLGDLGDRFYADPDAIRAAVAGRGSANIVHLETMFKVDLFMRPNHGADAALYAHARPLQLGEQPESTARIASPEDVVARKLAWYRQGGEVSEQQWRDVLGVLKVQRNALDTRYLRAAAAALDVADLLEQALDAAGRSS